ncbi:hypothetical protein EMCRGX_G027172 [Ephydatia muelleri]|eukprot:Em0014g240a
MKANFLAVLALVSFAACCNCAEVTSCHDSAIRAGVQHYQQMLNDSSPNGQGCCPVIVRPGPTGSVIAGFSGYRGNAAIIVNWGTCPAQPPGGFYWTVYWGDGTFNSQTATTLGPFQVTHQYPKSQNYYYVTVYYCSNPPYPLYPCCDVLYGSITTFQEGL